jgi:KipI family sensor histidine kinase inhibitor
MKIEQVSPNALLITIGEVISIDTLKVVQKAFKSIKELDDDALLEITPSYTTIFISFDMKQYDFEVLKSKLLEHVNLNTLLEFDQELVVIDVYYGKEVGLDLDKISYEKEISIEDIINIHSNKTYDVYAMGFLPGFAFLGEVDNRIATHRLTTPRNKVEKGSVAIADNQTAIYPNDSAGGWNIIGKTSRELFFKNNPLETLSLLEVGKQVRFNPITKKEFLASGGKI